MAALPRRTRTTDSQHTYPIAPNRLGRNFVANRPGQVWLADLTYIPTGEGWLYLAAVLDLHTRKIVGWSMRETLHTEIALEALTMPYRLALARSGITPSTSRNGDCLDNAPMESFFHSLKTERVHHRIYGTRAEAPQRPLPIYRGLLQFPSPAFGPGLHQPSFRRAYGGLTPSTLGEDQLQNPAAVSGSAAPRCRTQA